MQSMGLSVTVGSRSAGFYSEGGYGVRSGEGHLSPFSQYESTEIF